MDTFKGSEFAIEAPNPSIDTFSGSILYEGEQISLSEKNIVLRGCQLRNTEYLVGVITFVGNYTKIMQNSVKTKPKKSDLEQKLGIQIIQVFCVLLVFCFFASLINVIWLSSNQDNIGYIALGDLNAFSEFLVRFGNWVLVFGNFVPISLLVTLESVKVLQGRVIAID